jgi:hypothetical protein
MKNDKNPIHYFWDTGSDHKDTHTVYAVEYKGKTGTISIEEREKATDKARRKAFELTGDRKTMQRENNGFNPYDTGCKVVAVPYDTKPLKKWIGKKRQAIAEYEFGEEIDWEMFLDDVAKKMNRHTYWKIEGRSIDWRGRSGYKYVYAETAQNLMKAFYAEDIYRLYNGKRKTEFEINAPTHDTPMGSFYYLNPISENTYNKFND